MAVTLACGHTQMTICAKKQQIELLRTSQPGSPSDQIAIVCQYQEQQKLPCGHTVSFPCGMAPDDLGDRFSGNRGGDDGDSETDLHFNACPVCIEQMVSMMQLDSKHKRQTPKAQRSPLHDEVPPAALVATRQQLEDLTQSAFQQKLCTKRLRGAMLRCLLRSRIPKTLLEFMLPSSDMYRPELSCADRFRAIKAFNKKQALLRVLLKVD